MASFCGVAVWVGLLDGAPFDVVVGVVVFQVPDIFRQLGCVGAFPVCE